MRKLSGIFLILLLTISCSPQKKSDKPTIAVSILPQKYFVDRISGKKIETMVLLPPGASPATYAPTSHQIKKLSRVNLYLTIGYLPFELAWIKKIKSANKAMRVINTSTNINLIKEHGHIDPHTWLSPKAAIKQAKTIYQAVAKLDNKHKKQYKKNFLQLTKEIQAMYSSTSLALQKAGISKMIVFHPAWSYYARDYNITQIAIEQHGKNPSTSDIKRVVDTAKKEKIRTIFIQKQFATEIAISIANEINGKVIKIDPLAENWLQNMQYIAATLINQLAKSRSK